MHQLALGDARLLVRGRQAVSAQVGKMSEEGHCCERAPPAGQTTRILFNSEILCN